MKRKKILFGLSFILIFLGLDVFGQTLISAKELKGMINDENVVIASTRKAEDYSKSHITNAVNVYPFDLYKPGDMKGLLQTPEEMAAVFGSKGISNTKTIVVYDGAKGVLAGRLFWIFDYMGCKDVRILDGQLGAWRKARGPLTKNKTEKDAVTFNFTLEKSFIISTDAVKGYLNDSKAVMVDTRSKAEFDGEKGEITRKGHIPGAIHFEYKNVVAENGMLKKKEELQSIFSDAGITSDKKVILYCETSNRAGI
ncbi:MAG: sulfurtransferase, partial [Bacteroidales bacterium]|nr:sulfurtransferase [Bacteroidales bacterium]